MLNVNIYDEKQNIIIASFTEEALERIEQINIIEQEFAQIAKDKQNLKLILDFTKVWYLSSAVLGKLVLLRTWIISGQGELKLTGLSKDIYDIFKITRLDKFFEILPNQEEAIKSLKS